VALGIVFFPVLQLFPVSVIPPLVHMPDDVLANNTREKRKSSFFASRLLQILDEIWFLRRIKGGFCFYGRN
jgi:hypothetical protein